ncbi:MAG: glycerate kinase [Spirochaetaceae bacterium]|nr:glycerate kinase [Spirochaetaceae bacterium]
MNVGRDLKKVILIPDSFKGTMSSSEVCAVMDEAVRRYYPEAEIRSIPVADGGEGSVDSFLAAVGGEKIVIPAKGPYREDIDGFYGLIDNGKTAVIEMSACAGLPRAGNRLRPDLATTYGVGLLMADAARRGCEKIIIGLGGSATNDFGAGAAAATGIRFLDSEGKPFVPAGGTLSRVARIDPSGLLPEVKRAKIITMCDIDNPLYGETGAAYVFAPQKGADPDMVGMLDAQLRAIAETARRDLGVDVSALPGAGAAGGMGGGMAAFFGSTLQMGIDIVLDTVRFDDLIKDADLIFTGEGKLDVQSLRGKVVVGVARRAKRLRVPVIAVAGITGDTVDGVYAEGISAVFATNRTARSFAQTPLSEWKRDLAFTMDNLMRVIRLGSR